MALPSDPNDAGHCNLPIPSPSLSLPLRSSPTPIFHSLESGETLEPTTRLLSHSNASLSEDESRLISAHSSRPGSAHSSRPCSAHSSHESLKSNSAQVYGPSDEKDVGGKSGRTSTAHLLPSASLPNTRWTHRQWIHVLRLHWFTAYRVLIALTFVINIIVFAAIHKRVSPAAPLIATAANIFAAVLVRQEDIINLTFATVGKTSSKLPLWLGKTIADFHHYGGFHIGCAISALLWYPYFVYLDTVSFIDSPKTGAMWVDILTGYAFLLAIFAVCITALPRLRVKFHNTFEHTHRFGGWAALLVLWIHAGVSSSMPGSTSIYANAAVWLLAGTTIIIGLPWTRMRRVPITTELVSSREVKLSFPFKNMPYTSTMRFSLNPIMEWHAFATIPNPDGESAYIVISQAGDWTKAMIKNPPTHIWIRKPAAKNFLTFAPLFNSLLLVATGAGIGPMLSLLRSPAIAEMKRQGRRIKVMWCVYDPDAPHWQFVQDIIRNVDADPVIFDSRQGRPDVAGETTYMMREAQLEAVMVVSNPKVTMEVVEGVKGWGGAAYGAVFDS